MAKLRKMLGAADSPYIALLMRAIETQSKATLVNWCVDYCEKELLPIYKKYRGDACAEAAIQAARAWLRGEIKLPEAKKSILALHEAARSLEDIPAAQAAARAIGQSASAIHSATHSLGMCFYGAAAIAYDRYGTGKTAEEYDKIAAEECGKMLAALLAVSVENEPKPAKINWNC